MSSSTGPNGSADTTSTPGPTGDQGALAHPSFGEATRVWLKIGLLGFGGPAGQIALMHKVLVDEKRWIDEPRFLHALNYCMLLPGPEAQQLAIYIGWLLHRTAGGVVAGTLFVLPGFCVIMALSTAYALLQSTAWIDHAFFGLKAAVLAIVVEALVKIGKRALRGRAMWVLAGAAFVAIFAFAVPFPLIIMAAALLGISGVLTGAGSQPTPGAAAGATAVGRVLEESHTHTRPSAARSLRVVLVWGALWAAAPLAVSSLTGGAGAFPAMSAFFAKMAVVTFGGAYAVLAYVAQAAVEVHGWLQPDEMLDGLALAETTPGPLILVLTFVGFLAGYRDPGPLGPLAGGLLGGALTTWVTFVPCFLWIFLGAPYVETLRRNRWLKNALSAITAAVVGVVLNLTVWFALHVLFAKVGRIEAGLLSMPWPEAGTLDPVAVALSALAAVLLFWAKIGMVPTLLVCCLVGLLPLLR